MRRAVLAIAGCAAIVAVGPLASGQGPPTAGSPEIRAKLQKTFKDEVTPFVNKYCVECHGNRRSKAGVNFQPAFKDPGNRAFTQHWKQAQTNVRAHDMPPDDYAKQPTEAEREMFAHWVGNLKYLSAPDPGLFVIRRLSKAEYGNTLHDLFAVDPALTRALPDEVLGEGYLNGLSPLQSEQYLGLANAVVESVFAAAGAPPTAVQRRWFGEPPARADDERPAAERAARTLARAAYRRPPGEEEVQVLVAVYDLGRQNHLGHDGALGLMLKAVLVSPQFLYITPGRAVAAGQKIVPLDDHQLASRLSYFLWATLPDAELAALADTGRLHEPAVLRGQVVRLLQSPRARALFDGFGAQWLGLGELETKTFDPVKFPQMTPELRAAMLEEARLFFDSIVRDNRGVVSLIDCDYTFLNATLAPLYGLEKSVRGSAMRKVRLTDGNRGGILAMPAVLATTSFPNRTSAVRRGVWVLEQVLGERVPPAPPNVPALEQQEGGDVARLTLRQRTELHRTDPVCANCHRILDPIGFGLENFDAIGRWRDADEGGGAIDASGELPGGKRFSSPKELKAILAAREADVARNLTEKLLAYALCRQLEGYDEIEVDRLMDAIAKDGFRLQDLITAVVTSYPFTHRRLE